MIDAPNERSSHVKPTPKGGGLGFFIVFTFILIVLYFQGNPFKSLAGPLLFGGPVVVLLGWLDDRFNLSAAFRLGVHLLVAVVIYGLVTRWFAIEFSISFLPNIFFLNFGFCILFISWFINLYNFMDGADGLAATTAIVGSSLLALICFLHGIEQLAVIYLLLAYTVGGFLALNWQPARIFMGDTGSYFLGFIFASMALICKVLAHISFYIHIIIFGMFIVDATYTLGMRALRRQQVFQAHRQFAFHKLIAKGYSHAQIAVFYALVMIFWLFPMAQLASMYDAYGIVFVAISYFPLLVYEIYNRAGLPEGIQ